MAILARVYLIRHGETDANRDGIIQGQMDTPLNNLGTKQAYLVGEALRSISFDLAYTSDLVRASKTAEAILVHHPDVSAQNQVELRERFMGDMQGKLGKGLTGTKRMISADCTVESSAFFAARAVTWWNKMILENTASRSQKDQPYHILVVTHGGFIATLVKILIQSRKATCAPGVIMWPCMNTSVTIIEVGCESLGGTVVQYGDVVHLKSEQLEAVQSNADQVEVESNSD